MKFNLHEEKTVFEELAETMEEDAKQDKLELVRALIVKFDDDYERKYRNDWDSWHHAAHQLINKIYEIVK